MSLLSLKAGTTSKSIAIFVGDSSVTTGAGLTGLAFNTASLTAYYLREGGTATAITLATLAAVNSAYSSGGFKEVSSANMPGSYRLDLPNAALAAGASWVQVLLKGATNMRPVVVDIELTAVDHQDSVRFGMTALPNAAAAASGGVPVLGTNATAISFTGGMTISKTTGDALTLSSGGSNGNGLAVSGNGSGAGVTFTGGATGNGMSVVGGGTSGDGINVTTTLGHGMNLAPVGANKHGLFATGGYGGTGDGIRAVAGIGGVAIRGLDAAWSTTIEGSYSALQFMRLMGAALLGKASGLDTSSPVFRDTGDSTNRISATVDTNGNRTGVTLDAS